MNKSLSYWHYAGSSIYVDFFTVKSELRLEFFRLSKYIQYKLQTMLQLSYYWAKQVFKFFLQNEL